MKHQWGSQRVCLGQLLGNSYGLSLIVFIWCLGVLHDFYNAELQRPFEFPDIGILIAAYPRTHTSGHLESQITQPEECT